MTSRRSLARSSLVLSLSGLVLTIGCGGEPTMVTDAGPILLVDGGEAPDSPDAFVPPDAGDGTCGESISLSGWAPLPDSCLPRCSRETAEAVEACRSMPDPEGCVIAAVNADTTPPARATTHVGPLEVSCAGSATTYSCVLWQTYSCQYETCPAEYGAWTRCAYTGAACTEEFEALDTCSHASPDWTPCFQPRSRACFDLGT